jgi:hypothetical protein
MIKPFLTLFLLTRSFSSLFSPRFSITLLCLSSTAWEAEVFYCLGSIIDTSRAMFRSFLDGGQSTRRAEAWRKFCRYIRYVCHSLTERQDTDEAELTMTEQGHVPSLDDMHGLTSIFAMLSTTILLHVIDNRQYANPPVPLSPGEEEEIKLAQLEAQQLVRFLADKIHLVEYETGNDVSVEEAFVSYLTVQGRWLRWCLREGPQMQQDCLCRKLLAANFLQNDNARRVFQEEELWREWRGEAPDCFWPVDRLLGIGFPKDPIPIKRKLVQNPTDQRLKRQRM